MISDFDYNNTYTVITITRIPKLMISTLIMMIIKMIITPTIIIVLIFIKITLRTMTWYLPP